LYVVKNPKKVVAFRSQKILPVTRDVERNSWAQGNKHSRGPIWRENFRIFCFLKRRILVYFIFLSDDGVPKHCGVGVTYPYPSPSLVGPASDRRLSGMDR